MPLQEKLPMLALQVLVAEELTMTAGAVVMAGPRRSTRCRCQRHTLMLDSQRGAMRAARIVYDPSAGSKPTVGTMSE